MAVKIDIPGIGVVEAENFAQEDTLRELIAAVNKSEKTKRKDEAQQEVLDKKLEAQRKKELKSSKDQVSQTDKLNSELDDLLKAYEDDIAVITKHSKAQSSLTDKAKSFVGDAAAAIGSLAKQMLSHYDEMAKDPVGAAAGVTQTMIDLAADLAHLTIGAATAIGTAAVGWIPFVGDGLAMIVEKMGAMADTVVNIVQTVFTTVNEILEKEFKKRVYMLEQLTTVGASFAGGMEQMANYATNAGIGITAFTDSVVKSREYITAMGYSAGEATELMSKGYVALKANVNGKVVRDELLKLGYNFEQQGVIMAQYMAQQRALGVNLQTLTGNAAALANGTEEYAKHLKVISDITGQDAAKLMDQARAEAQRGALMTQLTGKQAQAFQDAYATLAAMPGDQAPKLQAALAQLLAGGVVTDPVIAGNKIIMDMLKTTAQQVSTGNQNMVIHTQENLSQAAIAYRQAGDSATDFATLMNPGGTSSVAQGMSQFGNALRQYRYDPDAAKKSMSAADQQAAATSGLSSSFVSITETMINFQNTMESVASGMLPFYATIIDQVSKKTLGVLSFAIKLLGGGINNLLGAAASLLGGIGFGGGADAGTAGGSSSAQASSLVPGLGGMLSGKGREVWAEEDTGAGTGDTAAATAQSATKQAPTQGTSGSETTYASDTTKTASAASGGILTGSKEGFAATLHGTEAVVPLPEGRHIPVEINTPAAATAPTTVDNKLADAVSKTQATNQQSAESLSGIQRQLADQKNKTSDNDTAESLSGIQRQLEANSQETKTAFDGGIANIQKALETKDRDDKDRETDKVTKEDIAAALAEVHKKQPINVNVDTDHMKATLQQHSTLLSAILQTMQKNNTLTSGILQQSY